MPLMPSFPAISATLRSMTFGDAPLMICAMEMFSPMVSVSSRLKS